MTPLRAREDTLPVDFSRLDSADGRVSAVVEHRARTRRGAELDEVEAQPAVLRPDQLGDVDARLAHAVLEQTAQRVLGEARDPRAFETQSRHADRHVQFAPADLHVERSGLLEALEMGRHKANHRLAECHHVKHRSLSVPTMTWAVHGSPSEPRVICGFYMIRLRDSPRIC